LEFKWIYFFHTQPDMTRPTPRKLLKKPVRKCSRKIKRLLTLAISLGSVVTLVDNKVLRLVVFPARKV
jgi:hypothetical protein